MTVILVGLVSFLLFVIYDINQVKWKRGFLNSMFLIGTIGLFASTLWLLITSKVLLEGDTGQIVTLIISGGFFLLLFYTLFFALPFSNTYIASKENSLKKVCDRGMYGICRHPGFIWFAAAYIMLAFGIQNTAASTTVAVFIICNFLYVIFQDRWTFPHIFEEYETYKQNVPFLIPTVGSLKSSFATIRKEG